MPALTYQSVRSQVNNRLLSHAFVRGQGGPLVLLWVCGSGLFLLIWEIPEYAAIWTLAAFVFAALIARDEMRNPKLRAAAHRSVLAEQFSTDELRDPGHREFLTKSLEVGLELMNKLDDIDRTRGLDAELRTTLDDMDRMLSLQFQAAHQIEELQRVLRLIGAERVEGDGAGAGLRESNVAAAHHLIASGEATLQDIGGQLETLVLQVFRMGSRAADLVAFGEARRRSQDTLDQLQQSVEEQRMVADQILDEVSMPSRPVGSLNREPSGPAPTTPATAEPETVADSHANKLVREALRHLSNPSLLAGSELVPMLRATITATLHESGMNGFSSDPSPLEQAQALRTILRLGVERLKPPERDDGLAAESLQYRVLFDEYIQGRPTKQIEMRYGISESKLHRHGRDGIAILTSDLLKQEERLRRSTAEEVEQPIVSG